MIVRLGSVATKLLNNSMTAFVKIDLSHDGLASLF